MDASAKPKLVDKEDVKKMTFPKEDVLSTEEAKATRMKDIKEAIELGDLAQYKVVITFLDSEGLKKVETTIWGIKGEDIQLKNDIHLPICRIKDLALSQITA